MFISVQEIQINFFSIDNNPLPVRNPVASKDPQGLRLSMLPSLFIYSWPQSGYCLTMTFPVYCVDLNPCLPRRTTSPDYIVIWRGVLTGWVTCHRVSDRPCVGTRDIHWQRAGRWPRNQGMWPTCKWLLSYRVNIPKLVRNRPDAAGSSGHVIAS